MATKKPAKKRKKKKQAVWDCVNPGNPGNGGEPYTLAEILVPLKDADFAKFFFDLIKRAQANEKGAIDCVNAYLEPTTQELQNLGIPASQIDSMRRCTDSGLLVLVIAQQNA
jgi:hypothetical protein